MLKKLLSLVMAVLALLSLTGCRKAGGTVQQVPADEDVMMQDNRPLYEEGVLLAVVKTEEEAQEIAEKCGITLENIEYGMARYHTEEDLDEVIERAAALGIVLEKHAMRQLY